VGNGRSGRLIPETRIQRRSAMDIAARALLVNTTVRVWTGEKRDRAITREICTMKGAEANAVRANKSLLGEHIHACRLPSVLCAGRCTNARCPGWTMAPAS
jgi:hypothetical protein